MLGGAYVTPAKPASKSLGYECSENGPDDHRPDKRDEQSCFGTAGWSDAVDDPCGHYRAEHADKAEAGRQE